MATKEKAPRFDKPCETCGEMLYNVLARATTCAACSGLKNDAYRRNVYAGLMRGFERAHELGLTGEAARTVALGGIDAQRLEQQARAEQERERKQQQDEARRQRAITNAFLKEHGYRWHKVAVGTEDGWAGAGSYYAGIGELDSYEWELSAPDGRTVTVAEAKDEIAANSAAVGV